jgi:hypothetical protein
MGADNSISYYDYTLNAWITVDNAHPLPVKGTSSSNQTPTYQKGAYSIQTGSLGALNAVVFDTFDAVDFQSVSVQVSGTFVGTITFQVSNDGTNWFNKILSYSNNNGQGVSATTPTVAFGDLGARYFRAQMTAYTSGTANLVATYNALASTAPGQTAVTLGAGANAIGLVGINTKTQFNDTLTTLAAGATFTGVTRDMGAVQSLYSTRVRVFLAHTAGIVHGHLRFEQSVDGTTFYETGRTPVPSDGAEHSFEFSLMNRYWRVLFTNGSVIQTAFRARSYAIGNEGIGVEAERNLNIPLSTTALAISGVYTSPTIDFGNNHSWEVFRVSAFADQAGTFAVQESRDNSNWRSIRPYIAGMGASISGPTVTVGVSQNETVEYRIIQRYIRVVYTNNGTTASTVFNLDAAIVSM